MPRRATWGGLPMILPATCCTPRPTISRGSTTPTCSLRPTERRPACRCTCSRGSPTITSRSTRRPPSPVTTPWAPPTFGPQFFNVTGDVVLVNDGSANPTQGCTALTAGSLTGKLALIDRGTCTFVVKVKNAQNAGAVGVIIANNAAGVAGMGGTDATITIGSLSVSAARWDDDQERRRNGERHPLPSGSFHRHRPRRLARRVGDRPRMGSLHQQPAHRLWLRKRQRDRRNG